jgi:4-amino-4-deoxy-L-arabinose transferase-like glycosyltransferase
VGVFLGLAFLTKGPVAILITGLVVFVVTAIRSKWHELFNTKILLSIFGLLAVVSLWVLPLLNSNGAQFLQEFINYQIILFKGQIEWHNQPWFYHIVVLFFVAFPSSILALPHLLRNQILDRNTDIWILVRVDCILYNHN